MPVMYAARTWRRGRFASGARVVTVAALGFLLPQAIGGQPAEPGGQGLYLIPRLSLIGVHDDNLFFSSPPVAESSFGRSSQGLDLFYKGAARTLQLGYSFEAEVFPQERDTLTQLFARQRASAGFRHGSPRSRVALEAGYLSTLYPQELVVDTGLDLGRRPSQSYTAHLGVGRRFSLKNSWDVDYQFSLLELDTREDLGHLAPNRSIAHELNAGLTHLSSATGAIHLVYGVTLYRVESPPLLLGTGRRETREAMSHGLTLGWRGQVGARTTLEIFGGPRVYQYPLRLASSEAADAGFGDEWRLTADVSASLGHRRERGELSLFFSRALEQSFGLLGFLTTERLGLSVVLRPHRRLTFTLAPSVFRNSSGDEELWAYRGGADARLRLAEWVSLQAAYAHNFQRGTLILRRIGLQGEDEARRNVVTLSLHLGYPFRL